MSQCCWVAGENLNRCSCSRRADLLLLCSWPRLITTALSSGPAGAPYVALAHREPVNLQMTDVQGDGLKGTESFSILHLHLWSLNHWRSLGGKSSLTDGIYFLCRLKSSLSDKWIFWLKKYKVFQLFFLIESKVLLLLFS